MAYTHSCRVVNNCIAKWRFNQGAWNIQELPLYMTFRPSAKGEPEYSKLLIERCIVDIEEMIKQSSLFCMPVIGPHPRWIPSTLDASWSNLEPSLQRTLVLGLTTTCQWTNKSILFANHLFIIYVI